jgi:hypothetical protein
VGLDSEASSLLNDPYHGNETDEVRRARRWRCSGSSSAMRRTCSSALGRPVCLGLARTPAQRLKVKPHNLLISCRSPG